VIRLGRARFRYPRAMLAKRGAQPIDLGARDGIGGSTSATPPRGW
jgi:hypothetical protein